jgi:hypothetical protein
VVLLRTLYADRHAQAKRAGQVRPRKQALGRTWGESDVGRVIAKVACARVGACQSTRACRKAQAEYARRSEPQGRREADERREEVPQDDCLRGM